MYVYIHFCEDTSSISNMKLDHLADGMEKPAASLLFRFRESRINPKFLFLVIVVLSIWSTPTF